MILQPGYSMRIFELQVAGRQLSSVIEQAHAGEDIVLAQGGEPVARIVAYAAKPARSAPRRPGALKGKSKAGPELFAPLPDDTLAAFGEAVPKQRKRRSK